MDEMLAQLSVDTLQAIMAELPADPRFAIWQVKLEQAVRVLTVDMPVGVRA